MHGTLDGARSCHRSQITDHFSRYKQKHQKNVDDDEVRHTVTKGRTEHNELLLLSSMALSPTTCYCGGNLAAGAASPDLCNQLSCHVCASHQLSTKIARYSAAKQKHLQKKRDCQLRLNETRLLLPEEDDKECEDVHSAQTDSVDSSSSKCKSRPLPDPNQINQQVTHLKERLDMLRIHSNDLAVKVTAKTMENDERESNLQFQLQKVILAQQRMNSVKKCLLVCHAEDNLQSSDEKNIVGDGRLRDALEDGRHQIQSLRFQFALRVFDMHRLDVGEEYSKGKLKKDNAAGVGKIGGLPLPHAGPALYGVLPQGVLASSLRLVASLTNLVSRCLGVVLPHPILVCAKECSKCGALYNFGGDVIDVFGFDDFENEEDFDDDLSVSKCNTCCCQEASACSSSKNQRASTTFGPNIVRPKAPTPINTTQSRAGVQSSRKSFISMVGTSARRAMALTASATSRAMTNAQIVTSTDMTDTAASDQKMSPQTTQLSPSVLIKRINHVSFAVLAESYESGATEYVLNPPRLDKDGGTNEGKSLPTMNEQGSSCDDVNQLYSNREEFHSAEERFSTGVQLLQNDVIALCFRAGVDVSKLWPAESMLLNLQALLIHCQAQVI